MIGKSDLVGKFITYQDADGKFRTNKVIKLSGNYVTVKDALKRRRRVYKDNIKGRQTPKRGLEAINWGRGL